MNRRLIENVFSSDLFLIFIFALLLTVCVIYFKRILNRILITINSQSYNLKKEIQTSVQTKFIQLSPEADVLIQLAVDYWRLNKKINSISKNLTEKEKQSLSFTLDRIKKHIDRFDIEIKDYTNEKYYEGLNVEVISVVKHKKPLKDSLIKDTIEPAIIIKGLLVKKAKVIVLTN